MPKKFHFFLYVDLELFVTSKEKHGEKCCRFCKSKDMVLKKEEYSCIFLFSKENEFFEANIIFNLLVVSESNNIGTGLWSQAINLKFV